MIPAPSRRSVLITGANRGIGLAFAKTFSDAGYSVIATARNLNEIGDLEKIKDISILKLDCCNAESIQTFDADWEMGPLDILLNNAAVFEPKELTQESMHDVFQVNSGTY